MTKTTELKLCKDCKHCKRKESATLFEPKLSLWHKLKNIFRKPQ